MKNLYWVPLLAFAVLVISSPAQAQDKAAVCQSNLRDAKAQGDIGKYDECISLASNALNMLGIPPTAKVGAK
jgi:hypothetical protein